MTAKRIWLTASIVALLPAMALAGPHTRSASPTPGAGWDHSNGPSTTGQPGASCGSLDAPFTPGQSSTAPGSAFNPDGTADSHYAGQQPQNSRNTASVSQYDSACLHVPG